MLDDGTVLVLANYVHIYSLYTRTTIFLSIGLLVRVHLNFAPIPQTQWCLWSWLCRSFLLWKTDGAFKNPFSIVLGSLDIHDAYSGCSYVWWYVVRSADSDDDRWTNRSSGRSCIAGSSRPTLSARQADVTFRTWHTWPARCAAFPGTAIPTLHHNITFLNTCIIFFICWTSRFLSSPE